MSKFYGQHNSYHDWRRIQSGVTTALTDANAGAYLEEERIKKQRREHFIFKLQIAYQTMDTQILMANYSINKSALNYIEGMPLETLIHSWARWQRVGDAKFVKYLKKEMGEL